MTTELHHGDCLEIMRDMPDNSVDAVITDPPYFAVKKNDWDNQWASEAAYFAWYAEVAKEFQRLLRNDGSVYIFCETRKAAKTELLLSEHFNILNRITWVKHNNRDTSKNDTGQWTRSDKTASRSFFPQTEIIIFAEHYNSDNGAEGQAGYYSELDKLRGSVFQPLIRYFVDEKKKSGLTSKEIQDGMYELTGKRYVFDRHTFTTSQWEMPTKEQYEAARTLFNRNATVTGQVVLRREYEDLRREYEDLRREYEDLRREYEYEDLRRPFNIGEHVTDVWKFRTIPAGLPDKHPCQKPVDLLRYMIEVSTRPNAVILDPFFGSGSTGIACHQTGRRCIGIEQDREYFEIARKRVENEKNRHRQIKLFEALPN